MNRSRLFATDAYKVIEERVKDLINRQDVFLTKATVNSPRAVGDAIQEILEENFRSVLGEWCSEYTSDFARRAMADLAFKDHDGNYYVVDVKTHRIDTKFNMPNLTSVERLSRFYEDDANYFVILHIRYTVEGRNLTVEDVHFVPIEFLDWDCLTIGALGWGQIQIANSNRILIRPQERAEWMARFCEVMLQYYPKEIAKLTARLEHFENVHAKWKTRR